MKKAIFLLFSSFVLWACNDISSCDTNEALSFMVLRFYDYEAEVQTPKKVGFLVTASDAELPFGLSSDSLAVGLPLDPLDTTVLFTFESDTSSFQLEMRYDTEYTIFDPSCDPSFSFFGLDTLQSTFDSTAIIGNVTNRQFTTNVEVYF